MHASAIWLLGCLLLTAAATARTEAVAPPLAAGAAAVAPVLPPGITERDLLAPGDIRLHVLEGGPRGAPRLLLVHGLGNKASHDWMPLLPELMRHFRIQAVDLPGFGQSSPSEHLPSLSEYAHLLHWLVEQGGPGPVHVAGHSLGGAVALRLAHDYPATIDRLLLLDPAGILHHTVFTEYMARVRPRSQGTGIMDEVVATGGQLLNKLTRKLQDKVAPRASNPTALESSNRALGLYGGGNAAKAALALAREDFSDELPRLKVPVWMLWGEADPTAPVRTGEALSWLLPRSSLERLPGIGHVPMLEAPEATLHWMLAALQGSGAPWRPVAAERVQRGHGSCKGRPETVIFSDGNWKTLTIERCSKVIIRNARIERLIVKNSDVVLNNVVIESKGTAIETQGARLEATGLLIRAPLAFDLRSSRIDLAATHILARQWGPQRGGSRLFFSLSHWCDGSMQRTLHAALDSGEGDIVAQLEPAPMRICSLEAPEAVSASAATVSGK